MSFEKITKEVKNNPNYSYNSVEGIMYLSHVADQMIRIEKIVNEEKNKRPISLEKIEKTTI